MPKLSIIVPVYNVQDYLAECLESLRSQSFKDWECILVDDGSTDSSGLLCDQYTKSDKRFKVIHQQNSGLSEARNNGLKKSIGEFITFVDSDDYIIGESTYERIIEQLSKDQTLDFIQFPITHSDTHNTQYNFAPKSISGTKEILLAFQGKLISQTCWNKIYKKNSIPETICFPKGLYYEDEWFCIALLPHLTKVMISNYGAYGYRVREGSITHPTSSSSNKHMIDWLLKRINTCSFAIQYKSLNLLYFNEFKRLIREVSYCYYKGETQYFHLFKNQFIGLCPSYRYLIANRHLISPADFLKIVMLKLFGVNGLNIILKLVSRYAQ